MACQANASPSAGNFNCGGTTPACYDPRADADDFRAKRNPDHIYFAVDDLETTYKTASIADCQKLDPIKTWPWGERWFYLIDPFGNPVCFVDASTIFTGNIAR